jgi:hypothetical protein
MKFVEKQTHEGIYIVHSFCLLPCKEDSKGCKMIIQLIQVDVLFKCSLKVDHISTKWNKFFRESNVLVLVFYIRIFLLLIFCTTSLAG